MAAFGQYFFLHFNLLLVSTTVIYYENMIKSSMECKNKTLLSLTYSEPWFIHNLGKFRTRGIFRALVYLEPWHIWNPRIFRTLGCFVKIVNILHEINIMSSLNICVIFTPIVCILFRKIWRPRERGR